MKRITKREAKKRFNSGDLVHFVPRKLSPQSWLCTSSSIKSGFSFEDTVAAKEHYYCNKMHGLKLAFYKY